MTKLTIIQNERVLTELEAGMARVRCYLEELQKFEGRTLRFLQERLHALEIGQEDKLVQQTSGSGAGHGAGLVNGKPRCPVPGLEHLWKRDHHGNWCIEGDYESYPKEGSLSLIHI